MKKRVLIMSEKMYTGGVEKTLIDLLKTFDYNSYDVTLLLTAIEGDLISSVPKYVNIITIDKLEKIYKFSFRDEMIRQFKLKDISKIFFLIKLLYKVKIKKDLHELYMFYSRSIPNLLEEYDVAISYQAPSRFPVVFVANNITAKYKIAWMHSDPSKSPCNLKYYRTTYEKYDAIFCVSKDVKTNFTLMFPTLKEKVDIFYNIIPVDEIRELALSNPISNSNFKGIKILTVGRLSPEKAYDVAIEVCEELINQGYNIEWNICGEGGERAKLEKLISQKNLENNFILLGNISNPYPLMRVCDIYCQPSRFEGYSTTLVEARILNKPIVITDVVGLREQIEHEKTGIIVSLEKKELTSAIRNLIDNKSKREYLIKNLRKEKFEFNDITKLTSFFEK